MTYMIIRLSYYMSRVKAWIHHSCKNKHVMTITTNLWNPYQPLGVVTSLDSEISEIRGKEHRVVTMTSRRNTTLCGLDNEVCEGWRTKLNYS